MAKLLSPSHQDRNSSTTHDLQKLMTSSSISTSTISHGSSSISRLYKSKEPTNIILPRINSLGRIQDLRIDSTDSYSTSRDSPLPTTGSTMEAPKLPAIRYPESNTQRSSTKSSHMNPLHSNSSQKDHSFKPLLSINTNERILNSSTTTPGYKIEHHLPPLPFNNGLTTPTFTRRRGLERSVRSWSCPSDTLQAQVEEFEKFHGHIGSSNNDIQSRNHGTRMSTTSTAVSRSPPLNSNLSIHPQNKLRTVHSERTFADSSGQAKPIRGISLDSGCSKVIRSNSSVSFHPTNDKNWMPSLPVQKMSLIDWLPSLNKQTSNRPRSLSIGTLGDENTSSHSNINQELQLASAGKNCDLAGCNRVVTSKGRCSMHGGSKECEHGKCTNVAVSGGKCISHGGGKRCQVNGCPNSAVTKGLCIGHGGGRRCQTPGCTRAVQSKGLCVAHGGGRRCQKEDCTNIARSAGLCIRHGGGRRCTFKGCNKGVVSRDLCMAHGGGRKCRVDYCTRHVKRKGLCNVHEREFEEGKISHPNAKTISSVPRLQYYGVVP